MQFENITIQGLVAVIDGNYIPIELREKAKEVLAYMLNTAIPQGYVKSQTDKNQQKQTGH